MTTYQVWRRVDGYVGVSVGPVLARFRAQDYDILLDDADLPTAEARLLAERDEQHYALVAQWAKEDGR